MLPMNTIISSITSLLGRYLPFIFLTTSLFCLPILDCSVSSKLFLASRCDELSTIYHFPDINYNKSPVISWLEYKMLPPPPNLRFRKEPLILIKDYKRRKGNIYTTDGSLLQVDKIKPYQKCLIRTSSSSMVLLFRSERRGKYRKNHFDEGKVPVQIDAHRTLKDFHPIKMESHGMEWIPKQSNSYLFFEKRSRTSSLYYR